MAINEDMKWKRKERDVEEDLNRRQERAQKLDAIMPQFNHYVRLTQPRSTIFSSHRRTELYHISKKSGLTHRKELG